jgi:Fe-S cluster assembly iron-binding protein IscA
MFVMQRVRFFIPLGVLASLCSVTAFTEGRDHKGVLLSKPRITQEQAIQIARDFLEDPQAVFTNIRFSVNRGGCWFPEYVMQGPRYGAFINARTGEVRGAYWDARKFNADKAPLPEGSFPVEKAIPIAREFLRRKFPGFEDSFELVWQRHSESEGIYEIRFGKTSHGIWLWRGGEAHVSTKTGEIVGFIGDYQSPTISLEPGISPEKAIEIAKSLVSTPAVRAEARLTITTDSIGEHRLEYSVTLKHGERVMKTFKGDTVVESIHTKLFLDAHSGELTTMLLPLGSKPNLKEPLPIKPGVVFNGYELELVTSPVVRENGILISDKLFEALGGDVDFDKASGKIVLSKGNDPATLFVGRKDAELNGRAITLPVAPEFTKGKLFIPATLIESVLGMKVK